MEAGKEADSIQSGPLARTNREIRSQLECAAERRREREGVERPVRYLDGMITRMELLHLRGLTVLPLRVVQELQAVASLLPPGVRAPRRWRHRIADAIEQCFGLEEQLQRVADRGHAHRKAAAGI